VSAVSRLCPVYFSSSATLRSFSKLRPTSGVVKKTVVNGIHSLQRTTLNPLSCWVNTHYNLCDPLELHQAAQVLPTTTCLKAKC